MNEDQKKQWTFPIGPETDAAVVFRGPVTRQFIRNLIAFLELGLETLPAEEATEETTNE